MNLEDVIQNELASLGTEADRRRGFKDVVVQLRDGTERVIRISVIVQRFAERAMQRYSASGNPMDLLPAMVELSIAKEVLSQVAPIDLARLANVAVALLMGPDRLREILTKQMGGLL